MLKPMAHQRCQRSKMNAIQSHSFRNTYVLIFATLMNTTIIGLLTSGYRTEMTAENSAHEHLQLVLVGIALLIFIHAGRGATGSYVVSARALAFVSGIAFYREIEIGNSPVMLFLTRAPFRDITVALLIVLLVTYLFRHQIHWSDWWGMLWQKRSWPLIGSGILLLTALLTDIGAVPDEIRQPFLEELMETNGYFLLLIAALRHSALTHAQANIAHLSTDRED